MACKRRPAHWSSVQGPILESRIKLQVQSQPVLHHCVAIDYQLPQFDVEEAAGCIKHHVRVAGFQGALFGDSVVRRVYDHTKGVARRINNACRNALLLGASEGKQILDETDLKRVILDLEGPSS